ncbi:methyl-accepting chemotaxis protein II [Methyloglobulus morosus KoM1]|uniref:Methyl-accepting chemotaxis protein II n=1 Tax=Methyloglobulus morosus KoM1 TaxID=1116472 RepID=V5CA08_9GAMM|nr:methyl-accepting chemotaxis protein [Methyloglobulus morosus]ESS73633.1 methyl-accepting chemotaxis protein II [Methyloglobulus morosus KoM1]
MKVNMPITNNEIVLKETATIVSATNLKGIITSVNRDFIEISGYTEKELIGHSHNIVRHPDMPPAAFSDLWQTMKAGKPWTGIVKNRCQNGDYYWVEANVTPLRKNGQIVGYMSVRNKPTLEQIEQAQALYRAINEGRAPNPGLIQTVGKKVQNLPIHLKFQSVLAVPILFMLLSAVAFKTGMDMIALGLVGGGALIGVILGTLLSRSVVRPLRQATQGLKTMSEGNLNVKFDIARDDEVGQVMQALCSVQIKIGNDMNETRKLAEESIRVRMALDSVSTNVMIADNDRNIIYMNKSVGDMLSNAESDLRKVLPNFNVSRLMGSSIDDFHKNPQHQKHLLATFTSTYRTQIGIGGRTFALTANPVLNEKGERLGAVVEWNDRTAELAAEKGINALVEAAINGELSSRISLEGKTGFAREIAENINKMLDAVIGPLNVAAKYVDDISKGNIPSKITGNYNGDFNIIKNNLNTCIDAVNALITDARMLSQAAVEGKLATRADASRHQGDYRKIVEGVNATLDAVVGPLNVAAKYVDDISKGNIPSKITGSYNGDFNIIKNNLNTCVDAVNALITDAGMLSQAAVEGKLATRADASRHQGDYRKIVEGVNATLDAVIDPLNVAAGYVERIAHGEIPEKITDRYNGDFNNIKNNLNTCVDAVKALINDTHLLSQAALDGNIQTRADASKHQGDFRKIVEGINATLETIVTPIITVKTAVDSISTAAKEISAGNADLSHRTEQQAASLEETASSMEELASTVKQNADNARQANQMAVAASDVAVKGGGVVLQVVNTMSAINESARKIVDIISVIDGIALQTNILALNAAVEAARAGEQGRGFAVVASEVRNLAQRSAAAAKEIKGLIGDSVEKVEDGSKLVGEAGKTMDEIVVSVKRVAGLMSEIAAASAEQSSGIDQVNKAVTQMDEVTQQNAALVEQAAAAAESLEEQAATLSETVAQFRLNTDRSPMPRSTSSLSFESRKPAPRLTAGAAVNTVHEPY